jgi:hypothetical protein
MKKLKMIIPILLSMILVINLTSCFLIVNEKKDNGQHKGWYKNTNNPHNILTTKKGHGNGKH